MQKKTKQNKKKKNRCWYNYGSYIKMFKNQQQINCNFFKKQWKTKINFHYYVETIKVRILEKRKKDKTK